MADPLADFMAAMMASGVSPIEPIADRLASGNLVRFRAEGDKPGRRNGWARLHLDGVPAGSFGHFRLGVQMVWRAGSSLRSMSLAERRAIVAQARESEARRKAETEFKQEAAAGVARDLWHGAGKADPAHGYLARKGLLPFGIRQKGAALLIPMVDCGFRLWNVQRIYTDGRKLFMPGGRTGGLFWSHGAFLLDGRPSAGPLVIGEGFATMAAIHAATRLGVVAAMSARNFENVASAMRMLFPSRIMIIAADNDCHLKENVGLMTAQKAAESISALLAVPKHRNTNHSIGKSGVDFADISRASVVESINAARSNAHG